MKKTVLVLGLGRNGSALAVSLADRGAEVVLRGEQRGEINAFAEHERRWFFAQD